MLVSFKDRVVLVTGASSGIGDALSREYGRRGANLILVARREDRLRTLASELSLQGVAAFPIKADLTQEGEFEKAVKAGIDRFGRLDVVVANAGFGIVGKVEELSLQDFHRQFETNIFGVIRTFHSTLNELKQTRGRFVVIGSVMGYLSLPGGSPYAMSKFAVRAMCLALWHELQPYGISLTHICPGFVKSQIRQVDNQGIWHGRAKDPIPDWLVMNSSTAARKIVVSSYFRRREVVITLHGKIAVWVERHLPYLLHLVTTIAGIRSRKSTTQRAVTDSPNPQQ